MNWLKAKKEELEEKVWKDSLGDVKKLQSLMDKVSTEKANLGTEVEDILKSFFSSEHALDKVQIGKAIKAAKEIYSLIQDVTPILNKLETLS